MKFAYEGKFVSQMAMINSDVIDSGIIINNLGEELILNFKRQVLLWLVSAIVLILATHGETSGQDFEMGCNEYIESTACTLCIPTITAFDVQITGYTDIGGYPWAKYTVYVAGEGYSDLIFQINVYRVEPDNDFVGGCSSGPIVTCVDCDNTIDDSAFIPAGCGEFTFMAEALAKTYEGHPLCWCSTLVTIPVNYLPTETENGNPPCPSQIGDPIDARSGNVYYEQRDVSIGSWSGLPIIFTRSYNSTAEIDPASILGPKWTHNFNYRVEDVGNGYVEFTIGTGQIMWLKDGTYPLGIGHKYNVDYDEGTERYTVLDYSTGKRFVFNDDGTLDSLYDREYGRLAFKYSAGLLDTVMDAAGRYLTFHYNANEMLDTIKQMNDSMVAAYEYSATGDTLKKVTYSNGEWESYHYTSVYKAKGLLDVIETSDSTNLNFEYDAMERGVFAALNDTMNVENVTYFMEYQGPGTISFATIAVGSDSVEYKSVLTSDSTHRVHSEITNNSCGCGNEYRYYDNYDIKAITYANDRTDSMSYGTHGKINKIWIDRQGPHERLASFYHGGMYYQMTSSSLPSLYDSDSAYISFTRDDSGNVRQMVSSGSIDAAHTYSYTMSFDYYNNGALKLFDGPRTDDSDMTDYQYFENGDLRYINRANGETFEFGQLDNLGNLTWMSSPNGDITRCEYDDYGRLTKLTLGSGLSDSLTTRFEHNYAGNITKAVYPKSDSIEYIYDDNGLLKDIKNQLGEKIHYEYDLYSRCSLAVIYDSSENMTKYEQYRYTPRGQVEKIIFFDSTFYEFEYDEMGNCWNVTDANGNYVGYKYDDLNRLDTIWGFNEGQAYKTIIDYDANGNLSKIIDPDSNVFVYSYSDNGRLVYDSSGATGLTRYGYDPAGNLIALKNAASDSIAFAYDEVNRLTRIAYPDSQNIDYEYDGTEYSYGLGRLYEETTPACTTKFQYDRFGRLIKEYRKTAGDTISRTTAYDYDKNSNVESVTYPSGLKYIYYYDELDRVIKIFWTKTGGHYVMDTLVYNIKYNPFGDAVEWTLGNGIVVSQSHNLRYFMDNITTDTFGIISQSYEFDDVGNIISVEDSLDSSNDVNYTYDDLYQLTDASCLSYPDTLRHYGYSNNGNRDTLILVDTTLDTSIILYEYTDNKLTEITEGQTTTTLSYDDIGNVTMIKSGNDSTTYQYNDAGQLVAVDDSATAQYYYDGRGRRIKVVTSESGRFVYYDQFGRIISEFRTGLNKWDRDFIYLNGRIIARLEKHYDSEPEKAGEGFGLDIDPPPPLPLPTDIDIFYYHTDHLGTPLVMTNDNGTVCWKARYYPFGELSYEWVSANNYIRFPGQWHDDETDLYYNWYRYYDPAMGRYLQPDPIGLAGGMNLYAYVGNNPIGFTDPQGLFSWKDLLITDFGGFDALDHALYWQNPSLYTINKLQGCLLSLLPGSVQEGKYLGTGYGEEALNYWRSKYDQKCNSWYQDATYGLLGWAAALWTPETWMGTTSALASAPALGRLAGVPRYYWNYYPKSSPSYPQRWLVGTRTNSPPFKIGIEARSALNLPRTNPATAVRRVPIRWWQPVRGPRAVAPQPQWGWRNYGSGQEYYHGWTWP